MTDMALTVRGAASVPADQAKALADRLLNNKGLFADDMTEKQALQIAMIAVAYGLDPIAGEVVPYEGKPLITLDGRIRVCADHPTFDGIEYTRVANDDERVAFRVRPEEDMWVASVWRKGVRFPSVGYGRAGGAYERNALVVGSKRTGYNPERGPELARKRAIVNALRLLFPMPRPKIPGLDDELSDAVWEDSGPDPTTVTSRVVNRATGEILEGEAREVTSLPSITHEQTPAIHAAAKSAGYNDEGYRRRLSEMFGTDSSMELNEAQAQAAIAAFKAEAAEMNDTAEERVAARRGPDGDPEEKAFYAKLEERAQETGDEQPTFFTQSAQEPRSDPQDPPVVSEHDPMWKAWQTLCAGAVAVGVAGSEIPDLHLPIAQSQLGECHDLLAAAVRAKQAPAKGAKGARRES